MEAIVGLNLCPWARPALPGLEIHALEGSEEDLLGAVLGHAHALSKTDPQQVRTSILVFPSALADWNDYLDFVDVVDALFSHAQLTGVIQAVSFHPDYVFEGEEDGDHAAWTNRSPYPALHLLREADLSEAVEHHPDPDAVPRRNMSKLRHMSLTEIRRIWGMTQ